MNANRYCVSPAVGLPSHLSNPISKRSSKEGQREGHAE
jgi:hypothetical protein